jgi:type II secretory pathway component GspD/PulD (secretin)
LAGGIKSFTFNRDIDAIFNMVASEAETEILSTPHILVRDEQTASIQVGESQPVLTGTTSTGTGTADTLSQVQYRDVGSILTVTPRIGENNMITLDISQELSEIIATSEVPNTPAFSTRKTETSLVIKSGHSIYMGGIIDIKDEVIIKKVPLLGDIPVLGKLFKSLDSSKIKTELMILIRPHIVNTAEEADVLTKEFKDDLAQIARMRKKKMKEDSALRKKILRADSRDNR